MSEPIINRAEPFTGLTFVDAEAVLTVVVAAHDHPMSELPDLFDRTFSGLFPALAEAGLRPIAPAFALYTRPPGDTVDIEVGIPVSGVLEGTLDLSTGLQATASELPGGRAAARTHLGGFDGLGAAWSALMDDVVAAGETPGMPFYEIYVTQPNPEMDPADLRTDLIVTLA